MKTSSPITMQRKRRHMRVRAKIAGTSLRPRLVVFRSNKSIYAQVIDDEKGQTLLDAREGVLAPKDRTGNKTERAMRVGEYLAKAALAKKITTVQFDRGGYRYHGRVKAFADGARKGGLVF